MDWTHPFTLLILGPFVVGALCMILPRAAHAVRAFLTIAGTTGMIVVAAPLLGKQELVETGFFHFRLDGLAALIVLAICAFGLIIAVYSAGAMKGTERNGEFWGYLLWTLGASVGAALANEFLLLLVFWGILAMTLYMMIGLGGPGAAGAAKKSLVIVGGTDSVLMLGMGIVWALTGTTRMDGAPVGLAGGWTYVAFLAFVAAAFAKAGAMPLHSWVPDCGESAPVPVTAFLPASLDKLLGIYLLVRTIGLFRIDGAMQNLLMILGAITIVLAVMMALVQHDMKRLLSYHAVSQVGYMVLGIGTGTVIGIAGGLFHMLNHAIYKSCLFLCAGSVEKRAGTTDLDRLGGLGATMPWTFVAFGIAALSISGIPPLNGFASKWMVYQGLVESGKGGSSLWVICLVAAMLGSALTLASFAKVVHAVFLCKPSPELAQKDTREVGASMWLPTTVLAAVCVVFGVFAYQLPLTRLIFPAIGQEVTFPGVWWAGTATIMLLLAFVAGLVFYLIRLSGLKIRKTETWIGGERLAEAQVTGEPVSSARHLEVTGVDFYKTVQDLPVLRPLYRAANRSVFDLYEVGRRSVFYFVDILRGAHTGVLSSYLTWFLVGLLALLYLMVRMETGHG